MKSRPERDPPSARYGPSRLDRLGAVVDFLVREHPVVQYALEVHIGDVGVELGNKAFLSERVADGFLVWDEDRGLATGVC